MTTALLAGTVYFAIIFALGFVIGVLRVLIFVPRFGETTAVLFEAPLMLSASWLVCRVLIRNFDVEATIPPRLVMGAAAFALLMAAELLLGIFVFGRNFDELLFHYQSSAGVIGLAGQIAFALMPVVQLLTAERR